MKQRDKADRPPRSLQARLYSPYFKWFLAYLSYQFLIYLAYRTPFTKPERHIDQTINPLVTAPCPSLRHPAGIWHPSIPRKLVAVEQRLSLPSTHYDRQGPVYLLVVLRKPNQLLGIVTCKNPEAETKESSPEVINESNSKPALNSHLNHVV